MTLDAQERVGGPWHIRLTWVAVLCSAVLLSGCTLLGSTVVLAPSPEYDGVCHVTVGGPAPLDIKEQLFGSDVAFGTADLWVGGLGPNGMIKVESVDQDGTIGWKFGWWRYSSGSLTVTGRRIDAAAAPMGVTIPDGYGDGGFQPTGVSFPTPGCWQVTGSVGERFVSFVTLVVVQSGNQ